MKKKLLVMTPFLSIATFLLGQTFGSIGTSWYYSEHAGGLGPPNSEYLHLESVKDTLINGVTTHKIERNYYRFKGDTAILEPIFVYEQSDTVYMYNFLKSRFQTIYIFNASQGDTITLDYPGTAPWTTDSTYRLFIDSVETILINGFPLKKYKTLALDKFIFWSDGYFMDRIGGLDWFFPRAIMFPEAGGPIRCYSDPQIDTNFLTFACDYRLVSSVKEVESETTVKIFPNPVQNILTIQSGQPIERVDLRDLTGKKLITSNQLNLNCEQINSGFYLLTIYMKSDSDLTRK